MLLSFIIPAFNSEGKISRCLDSLISLKCDKIEFIIINDGSTDNTKAVCEEYVRRDSRICLINQKNTGVSGARNTGIKYSSGKYITFADSDDEITERYAEIIEIIKKEKCDLYSFDFWVQNQKDKRSENRKSYALGINGRNALFNNYLSGNTNTVWCNIYRSDIIKRHDVKFPLEMKMGEDAVFNAQYLQYCNNVYYIKENGYRYYVDDKSSATYARKSYYLWDFIKIYDNYLMIYQLGENLDYPTCEKYHINNIYSILKRHSKSLSKLEKKEFRKSAFCKNLLSQNYKSWRHEVKKWCIFAYLYLP